MRNRMAAAARDTLIVTMRQRCFWLFAALLLLLVSVPFLEAHADGRVALNVASLLTLIAGATAITQRAGAALITLLLAVPAALSLSLAVVYDQPQFSVWSQAFGAAFYFAVTSYLLSYTLRRDVMTMDKLYGAAAAFLLLGILWGFLYSILLTFYPGALAINGAPMTGAAAPSTMLYFSFVTLTATGMSDIMPVHPVARMLCSLEMITGVLFIAVLIARLAGSYPPREP